MKRLLRRLLLGVLVFGTTLALGLVALLFLTPRDQIVPVAVSQFQTATGLQVEISDRFEPQIWPIPGWRLGPVRISAPSAPDTAALLSAKDALLSVAPRGLAQRTLRIGALWLDDVAVELPGIEALSDRLSLPADTPYVGFLRLRNARVELSGDSTNAPTALDLDFAAVDYAGTNRPLHLRGSGVWKNRRIQGSARLTSPDRAARGDWVFAQIEGRIDGDPLSFAGRFLPDLSQDLPTFAGTISVETANPAGAISWLTDTPPDATLVSLRDVTLEGRIETLPERLLWRTRMAGSYRGTRVSLDTTLQSGPGWRENGTGTLNAVSRSGGLYSAYLNGNFAREHGVSGDLSLSVLDLPGMVAAGMVPQGIDLSGATNGSVKGRLSATTEGLAIADADLKLGSDRYTGDFALDLRGDRPVVSLGTAFDSLDVGPWVDALTRGTQPMSRILPSLDADLVLEFTADRLQLGDVTSGQAVFSVQTLPDATTVDLRRLDLFEGTLSGTLSSKPNSQRVAIDLSGAEIDAASALAPFDLSGIRGILGGTVRAELPVNLAENGWRTVTTDAQVSLFQGEVGGINLRTRDATENAITAFTQLELDLKINDSQVALDRITLTDVLGRIEGIGSMDLANGAIAFNLQPDDADATVAIEGTRDAPRIVGQTSPAVIEPEGSEPEPSESQNAQQGTAPAPGPTPIATDPAEPEPAETPQATTDAGDAREATAEPSSPAPETPAVQLAENAPAEEANATTTAVPEPAQRQPERIEIDPDATGPEDSPLPPRPRR